MGMPSESYTIRTLSPGCPEVSGAHTGKTCPKTRSDAALFDDSMIGRAIAIKKMQFFIKSPVYNLICNLYYYFCD